MSMQFKFNPEKAVEVAARFLQLHGTNSMKYLGLIKLLYTADRIAFQRLEQSITGDSYVSMKYGPVLSNVYDLIKGQGGESAQKIWADYITTLSNDHEVRLTSDPGVNHLCKAELKIIDEVYKTIGNLDRFELAEKTHQEFPEWRNPLPAKSAPIYIEEILRQVGKSDDEIRGISEELEKQACLEEMLNEYQ